MSVNKWQNGFPPMDGEYYEVIARNVPWYEEDLKVTYQGLARFGTYYKPRGSKKPIFLHGVEVPRGQVECWVTDKGSIVDGFIRKWRKPRSFAKPIKNYYLAF